MPSLSSHIQRIQGSPTLALNELARQLQAEGKDIIHFGIGEPQNEMPASAQEYLLKKLRSGQVKYGPTGGMPALKLAVIDYTKSFYGRSPAPENIMITVGAKQALYNLLQCLLNQDDEVILLSPYWVSYPEMIKLAYGRPVVVQPDQSLIPDVDAIIGAVTSRTRAIILNNPNNPSGVCYPVEMIAKLVDFCETKAIYLIMDDIYHQLMAQDHQWVPGYVFTSQKIDSSYLVVINGISKSYGMTGFRIGWIIAAKELTRSLQVIQGHSTSGASVLLQEAALGALKDGQDTIDSLSQQISKNRKLILDALAEIPGVTTVEPGGTFYCFPDFSAYHQDSRELASRILEKAFVATVPGITFGREGHLRLSYAGPTSQIEEGIQRIRWVIDPDAPEEITIQGSRHQCDWKRTYRK